MLQPRQGSKPLNFYLRSPVITLLMLSNRLFNLRQLCDFGPGLSYVSIVRRAERTREMDDGLCVTKVHPGEPFRPYLKGSGCRPAPPLERIARGNRSEGISSLEDLLIDGRHGRRFIDDALRFLALTGLEVRVGKIVHRMESIL